LAILVGCRMVNISLTHGTANTSNQGYAILGLLMGPAFGRYHDGYQLARLAGELAEGRRMLLNMARVGNTLALAASWTQPLTTAVDCWRKAYRRGLEAGDLYFSCFSAGHIGTHLLLCGQNLQQAAEAVATATGVAPVWWRPPYGVMTTAGLFAARRHGLRPLLWSAWGKDWRADATVDTIVRAVLRGRLDGGTVLLHDSDTASTPDTWKRTAAALPLMAEQLAVRGLRVAPLPRRGPR